MATPINRGPGSVNPGFTAPSVPVATPGFQQQAEPTEFERFRDAVVLAGQGVASAVSARAAINNRLKTLKEQSVSRVEQGLARSAAGLQERRLQRAAQQRVQILDEAGSRGMEWAERRFRSAMVNAGSAQESALWEQSWRAASQQVDRTNAEARQQAFNSAARTMKRTTLLLRQQIAEDPSIEATLIGDGTNIGARVQDWMLSEINSAMNLDGLTEEDADLLIHQTVKQSFGIADDLIRVHTQRVQSSNELLGTQQLEADLFAALSGQQEPGRVGAQIGVTLRDRLSHLTIDQQMDFTRRTAAAELERMADGEYGLDSLRNIGAATDVLNMVVDGEPVFDRSERQRLAASLLSRAERTAVRSMQGEMARLREAQTSVVRLQDGTVVHRPSANPDAALSTPDPITGLTPVDEAANRLLGDMGLLGQDNLSPESARIVGAVRAEAARLSVAVDRAAVKRAEDVANFNTVVSGQPGGNANEAASFSPYRRAYQDEQALIASDQSPLSGPELQAIRQQLHFVADAVGGDHSVIENWDGSPLSYDDDSREINRLMAISEARQWSSDETQSQYGIPSTVVTDKLALLGSSDPNRVEAFAHWALNLESGPNGAWENFLTADGVSPNDAAAAQWVRINFRLGGPTTDVRPDMTAIMQQVQAIQSAPPVTTWMRSDTGDTELQTTNAGNMAAVMAKVITEANSRAKFNVDSRDRFNNAVQAQLQTMFASDTNGAGRMLSNLWFAGRTLNPNLDDGQVGSMIWGWLQKDGWRFREVNGRTSLVIDPNNYTGSEGGSIQDHVVEHSTKEFTPEYRAFLMDALDLPGSAVPTNLQSLYQRNLDNTDRAFFNLAAFTPTWSLNDPNVTDRMLAPRAEYGGFVVRMQAVDGTDLGNVVSRKDATLRWADGTEVFVPKGTVLNVISPDLFLPPATRRTTALPAPALFAPGAGMAPNKAHESLLGARIDPGMLMQGGTATPDRDPFGNR